MLLLFSYFYPRPPRGGRRSAAQEENHPKTFLSPPSARRATIPVARVALDGLDFYPRPPRGGRQLRLVVYGQSSLFLSTPSARRATILTPRSKAPHNNFYPRPPRGGRPIAAVLDDNALKISIHAPRAEGDRPAAGDGCRRALFLSTPSARRATAGFDGAVARHAVFLSTPSARRATAFTDVIVKRYINFYPRPPRGGRPRAFLRIRQSRRISIHALREEGD